MFFPDFLRLRTTVSESEGVHRRSEIKERSLRRPVNGLCIRLGILVRQQFLIDIEKPVFQKLDFGSDFFR